MSALPWYRQLRIEIGIGRHKPVRVDVRIETEGTLTVLPPQYLHTLFIVRA